MLKYIAKTYPLWILALVLIVVFWRLWIGEAFFWGIPSLQFVPWRFYAFDALRHGHLPLWNPYNGAGAPLFANYQSALLYPPNWIGLGATTPTVSAWLYSVLAVGHLFWAGLGMWHLTAERGYPIFARGVSVLSFALGGYVIARLGTYPTVSVYAWLGWLIWLVERAIKGTSAWDSFWLAWIVAMILTAGHAQTAWYSLLLAAAWGVVCWGSVRFRQPLRIIQVMLAVGLGVGLATWQLLATADLTVQSQRSTSYGDVELALQYSYAPLRTLNLFAPNVFGNPGDGSYVTEGAFFEDAVYIGLIPLLGAIFAIIKLVFSRQSLPALWRLGWFWVAVVVVGFNFALGQHNPVFMAIYERVPTFDMFQAPVRWHLWTVFGLSLLAGMGVSAWSSGVRTLYVTRLMTAGAVGMMLLSIGADSYLSPSLIQTQGVSVLRHATFMTALWLMGAGLLTLLKAEALPTRFTPPVHWEQWWQVAVMLVVAVDVGWGMRGLNPTIPASFYASVPVADAVGQRTYWTRDALNARLFGTLSNGDPSLSEGALLPFDDYRVAEQQADTLRALQLPNLNILDQTYSLNNFDPLVFNLYDLLLTTYEQGIMRGEWQQETCELSYWCTVGTIHTPTATLQREQVSQRAVITPSGTVHSIEEQYGSTVVEVVTTADEAYLWLLDFNTMGWVAYVNGTRIPTNNSLADAKQVPIPSGESTVRFVYEPWWNPIGAIASGGSLVVMGLWAGWIIRHARRTHPNKAE